MPIPKYIQDILRTKNQRLLFERHNRFLSSIFSSLKFLHLQHEFILEDLCQHRHELWVRYRKKVPIPIAKPKFHTTYIDVVVETEYFMETWGRISLLVKRNESMVALRTMSFHELAEIYQLDQKTEFSNVNGIYHQLMMIKHQSDLLKTNWRDVTLRLSRNIPKRKITG